MDALHTFYAMSDGSCLAFFDVPDMPFEFKPQHDFDLHLALEVDEPTLSSMLEKAKALGLEARGIIDHGVVRSIYIRDPNGYVVELAANTAIYDAAFEQASGQARSILDAWRGRSNAASHV